MVCSSLGHNDPSGVLDTASCGELVVRAQHRSCTLILAQVIAPGMH